MKAKNKIFVYGTLRPSNFQEDGSYGYDDATHTVTGFKMFSNHAYPFLREGEGVVRGNIIEVDEDGLKEADAYESVDSGLYVRQKVTATSIETGESEEAFVYVAGPAFDYPVIESGDWKIHTGK